MRDRSWSPSCAFTSFRLANGRQLGCWSLAAVLFSAACSKSDPAKRVSAASSWLSTASMVGDAWLRHSAPDKYTRGTLELSRTELLTLARTLIEKPPPAINNKLLIESIGHATRTIGAMEILTRERDAPRFRIALEELKKDEDVVSQMSNTLNPDQ